MTVALILAIFPLWSAPARAAESPPPSAGAAAAGELIQRVLPHFAVEAVSAAEAGKDVFEIEARVGGIVLRGNNGLSLAMAFNWYLRHELKVDYDWQAVGPLPWHRMANLDKWGGPLPMSYIAGQKTLQQQIVRQARALGMKPILGGFAGHVPEALKAVKPAAKITGITPGWGDMDAWYATWFIDPTDPLFGEIQGRYLKQQSALYGRDHLYGAPFLWC